MQLVLFHVPYLLICHSGPAHSAESVEKCAENTKPSKSYAEMTKKSVEQYSDATRSRLFRITFG